MMFPALIEDNIGKIMFVAGAFLLIVGVLTLSMLGSVLSAGSLFLGMLFTVFGLFVQLGFLSENLRTLGGAGTVLICLSIVFVAFSFAVFEFLDVVKTYTVAEIFKGFIVGWKLMIITEPSYAWLSSFSMQVGIVSFVLGVLFKVVHSLRQ